MPTPEVRRARSRIAWVFAVHGAVFGSFAKHWLLGMGLAIIVCVALLPRGLIGVADRLKARRTPQPVQAT